MSYDPRANKNTPQNGIRRKEILIMSEQVKKFEFVFSRDDIQRFSVVDGELYVDVHGLTCPKAQRLLKNTIALLRGDITIYVIHGYNHGHAIKEMLRNTKLSRRNYQTQHVDWNPGMTKLVVA